MTLEVVSANVPNDLRRKVRAKRILRQTGADTIGLQEIGLAANLPMRGYRTLRNNHGRDQRRGAKDVLILTRNDHHSLGNVTMQVSEQVKPTRFAPDRWGFAECFQHQYGRIAHTNWHLNATAMKRRDRHPLVEEYAESVESLDRMLSYLRAEGFAIVLTADLNWRRNVKAEHSPFTVLADHGLRVHTHNVDVIAHDKRFRPKGDLRIIEKSRTGSDHDWLDLTLVA